MGVVYSVAEIERGYIPKEDAHLRAAELVIDLVGGLQETRLTVVHGSVPDGRFNVRSDLDVLVTYTTDEPSSEPAVVRKLNSALDEIGDDTHVKIEANIWPADEDLLARRERMYDLLFSRHLAESMRSPVWAIGEIDPTIEKIAEASYEEGILRGVVLNYTTYKHAGFTKAPRAYAENDKVLSVFQRALELPKSLDRKVGQFLGIDVSSESEALTRAGMNDETISAMELLRRLDAEYTDIVSHFQQNPGPLDKHESAYCTNWLAAAYPKAVDSGLIASSGFSNFVSSQ